MPTVSAIIATYNRADILRRAVDGLLSQSRPPDEILVVDDASPDNTRAMMAQEFPGVRYVRVPCNMGHTYNRNLGVMSTKGDYILSIDDDAWFEEADGLARAVAFMESRPDIGAIALNVRQPNGWLFLPLGTLVRDVGSYIGCSCLMRRAVAEKTLYIPEMRSQEEADRSLRIYDLGYHVVALPDVVMFHALSVRNRNWARFRYTIHRSGLIREIARCPLTLLPWRFLAFWAGQTVVNLREGHFTLDFRILWDLPRILRIGLRNRVPVRLATYRMWRAIVARDGRELGRPQGAEDAGDSEW